MDFANQFQGVLTQALLSLVSCAFPSLSLSHSFFFLQVVTTCSSVDTLRKNHSFHPSPCVFYVCEISQEFAYVQITSRWFEISHRQICLRQPYLFSLSALQARHIRAHFECPGTLHRYHRREMNTATRVQILDETDCI